MKLLMFIAFLLISVGSVIACPQVGATPEGWRNDPIQVFDTTEVDVPKYDGMPCSGVEAVVKLSDGHTDESGCIFGDVGQVRVARYVTARGEFRYAVSFPLDVLFYPIRGLCEGTFRCTYAPGSDALLMASLAHGVHFNTTLYHGFTNMLTRATVGGVISYDFVAQGEGVVLGDGQRYFSTGNSAFSKNGKWAVVELREYGVVRVDVTTGTYRRIIAPGAIYGRGNDPAYELAISNSGTLVAVVGIRLGLEVYWVDENCGDVLNELSEYNFGSEAVPCRASEIDRYSLLPGFFVAQAPLFSGDEETLSVSARYDVGARRVRIGPSSVRPLGPGAWYIAFGDSYVSGEGETDDALYFADTNIKDNKCHRSKRSYPFLVGARWQVESKSFACSGARIKDVLSGSGSIPAQNTYIDRESPELITVGIGGNDAGLMAKLKGCLGIDTCEWALPGGYRVAASDEIKRLFGPLVDLVRSIKAQEVHATVALVGYPEIINESPRGSCDILSGSLFNADERRFMGESIRYLNKVIETAARASGAVYVDIEDSLRGARLCDDGQTGMNAVRMGDDIAPIAQLPQLKVVGAESFHPTPYGHTLIASSVLQQYEWSGLVDTSVAPHFGLPAPTPDAYWSEGAPGASPVRSLLNLEGLLAYSYEAAKVTISVPKRLFAANTKIDVELHSNVLSLGSYETTADGSLTFTVEMPTEAPPGYHTVHLLGTDLSGGSVDAYFPVFLERTREDEPLKGRGDIVVGNFVGTRAEYATPTLASLKLQKPPANGLAGTFLAGASVLGSADDTLPQDAHAKSVLLSKAGSVPTPISGVAVYLFGLGVVLLGWLIWLSLRKGRGG